MPSLKIKFQFKEATDQFSSLSPNSLRSAQASMQKNVTMQLSADELTAASIHLSAAIT